MEELSDSATGRGDRRSFSPYRSRVGTSTAPRMLLERGGLSDVALPFVVLGAWSIVFLGLALARLRRADLPLAWA